MRGLSHLIVVAFVVVVAPLAVVPTAWSAAAAGLMSASVAATVSPAPPQTPCVSPSSPVETPVPSIASASTQPLLPASDIPEGTATLGDRVELPQFQFIELPRAERGALPESDPGPGATYYTFVVAIEAIDASTTYNPLYFKMRDDQGFEYEALDPGRQPSLKSGDLLHGQRLQGWLTFAGPVDTAYVDLVYTPVSFYGGQAIFRVATP